MIGISTDGAAPMFGQAIRSRIEALMPVGLQRAGPPPPRHGAPRLSGSDCARRAAAALLGALRRAGAGAHPTARRRRTTGARCWQTAGDVPRTSASAGHVTLVGAGPGDPELLTLKALRALRSADVILFDDLVAPEILDFARREAKRMLVGKTGHRTLLQAGRHQRADGVARARPASAWCA